MQDTELMYQETLKVVLNNKINKKLDQIRSNSEVENFHHHALNGLIETTSKIISYSRNKLHFNQYEKHDGYHIYATDIKNLKRNRISKYISLFDRHPDSTYHRNSRGKGSSSNGYPHWYLYSDLINQSLQLTDYLVLKRLLYVNKFSGAEPRYLEQIKSVWNSKSGSVDSNYIRVPKERFLLLYKHFKRGFNHDFPTILKQGQFFDGEYVYLKNDNKYESLDGFGRQYTLLGSISGETRKFLLPNHTEIDINTAIQTILVNLYFMNTNIQTKRNSFAQLKNLYPEHYLLLSDKHKFREKYKRKFKCDIELAKKIITKISYAPSRRVIYNYTKERGYFVKGIPYQVDFTPSQIVECKKLIDPFVAETKKIRKEVIRKFYNLDADANQHFKIGDIYIKDFKKLIDEDIVRDNKRKEKTGRGQSLEDRRIYRINELVEHQIRSVMINFVREQGIDYCHQNHDCIIFDGEVDVQEMRKRIYEKLNINVGLTVTKYD